MMGNNPSRGIEKSKPEIQFQKWEYHGHSVRHRKLLSELCCPKPEIEHKGNLRVIFSDEFSLGQGSNETRVFLGLTKDGYGKAVKRMRRNNYLQPAQHEKKILNEFNARESKYVVNYYFLEEDTGTDYVYLILDLCEESLKKFVEDSIIEDLQKALPDILRQILNGLADLHSGKNPILHRDLKPSNVLRDSHDKFLIADFGISRILNDEFSTYESNANTGTEYWIAPESYREDKDTVDKGRYKKKSDVYNAGMVAYYVATKGQHPFGVKRHRLDNMLKGNPVGLDEIKNKTLKDLLMWMLNRSPEDRPSANEALKHPFFMSDDKKFEMLCKVGNQLSIKTNDTQSSVVHQINNESSDWRSKIDSDVYAYFTTDEVNGKIRGYGSSWTECLRLIRNLGQHWNDRPRPRPQPFYKIGDHKLYFIKTFPDLPVRVHAAFRSNKKLKNNSEDKDKDKNDEEKTSMNGNGKPAISEEETSVLDNSHIVKDVNEAGQVCEESGEYHKAKEFYEKSREKRKNLLGSDPVKNALSLNNLGDLYFETEEYDKSKECYEKALEIYNKLSVPDHSAVAAILKNLGNVYMQTGEYDKAKKIYEKDLEICKMSLGPDHVQVAVILNNLGNVYMQTGDYEKAKELYEKTLGIRKKLLSPDHFDVCDSLCNLGLLHEKTDEYDKAKEFYEKALKIYEKYLGPDHVQVVTVLENLRDIDSKTKEYDRDLATDEFSNAMENEHFRGVQYSRPESRYLLKLAGRVSGEWKLLARSLHIKDDKINQIDLNQNDEYPVRKGYLMLELWWFSRDKKKLWYEELAGAFHRIGKDIDTYLLELAEKVPREWKVLAKFLHIKDEKIDKIDINQIDVVWKGYTMLKVWWDSGGNKNMWYKELATAFHRIGKDALAQKIVTEGPNVTINNEISLFLMWRG